MVSDSGESVHIEVMAETPARYRQVELVPPSPAPVAGMVVYMAFQRPRPLVPDCKGKQRSKYTRKKGKRKSRGKS